LTTIAIAQTEELACQILYKMNNDIYRPIVMLVKESI